MPAEPFVPAEAPMSAEAFVPAGVSVLKGPSEKGETLLLSEVVVV